MFWVINLSSCFRTVTSDSDRFVTDTGDIDELDGGGILFFMPALCRTKLLSSGSGTGLLLSTDVFMTLAVSSNSIMLGDSKIRFDDLTAL